MVCPELGCNQTNGEVNIILCDGYTLDANSGITIKNGSDLIIWGQEGGTGTINATGTNQLSGIGAGKKQSGQDSSFVMNGGTVNATGTSNSAGVGTSYAVIINPNLLITNPALAAMNSPSEFGDIIINGGTLNAEGIVGIGCYNSGVIGDIIINGGNVSVDATYSLGVGIGGLIDSSIDLIEINGGVVYAQGEMAHYVNSGDHPDTGGPGIGVYNNASIDTIHISGGVVTAVSGGTDVAPGINLLPLNSNVPVGTLIIDAGLSVYAGDNISNITRTDTSDRNEKLNSSVVIKILSEEHEHVFDAYYDDGDTHCACCSICIEPAPGAAPEEHDFGTNGVCTVCGAKGSVTYINKDGNEQTRTVYKTLISDTREITNYVGEDENGDYHLLQENYYMDIDDGWYVLSSDVTYTPRLRINGTVHIILCDGYTLDATNGIYVADDSTLNIYSQSGGTGTVNASTVDHNVLPVYNSAIGSNYDEDCGTVNIYGGRITADSTINAEAIGHGEVYKVEGLSSGTLTV